MEWGRPAIPMPSSLVTCSGCGLKMTMTDFSIHAKVCQGLTRILTPPDYGPIIPPDLDPNRQDYVD